MVLPLFWLTHLKGHDYKAERLAELAERLRLGSLDFVFLQEFYGCWYSDSSRKGFLKLMITNGFKHRAVPPATGSFPSLWANSGLAVFSREHEVKDLTLHAFKRQSFYDKYCVNRGVCGCSTEIDGKKLWIFSIHCGPPMNVLSFFDFLPSAVQKYCDVFEHQVVELAAMINMRKGEGEVIVGGDYNCK
ncbi:hypothetical protein ScalyP_jg5636 [Parmales sp. scaly parma]|nr:hypothetical protein ScalyP_jg5636 [Parmales sp. scaly parma]